MAPHTVWVTACAESVPTNGDWRYCSATWNFGDGSTVTVQHPVTGNAANTATDQTSWACASHTYEVAGTYTITLTLTGSDGIESTDTVDVTVVADARTTKYLDSAASPGGDGSISTPWSTLAEMIAGITSDTTVLMDGSFTFSDVATFPVVSNIWLRSAGSVVTFTWSSSPSATQWIFFIPADAENVLIDGKLSAYTDRMIVFASSVAKTLTQADNKTGCLKTTGNAVKMRNCSIEGTIDSGGLFSTAIVGGSAATNPNGLTLENCDVGDCNAYLSVFTQTDYVNWLGVTAGTAWIEHTQRWLSPTWSKYIGHQWSVFDHKRIVGGVVAASGAGAKDCIRFQAAKYATVSDCYLTAGVLDISYHTGVVSGDYGPGHYIQYNRCVINDCGIYLRPNGDDISICNCYIKNTGVISDIATPTAGDKVLTDVSLLHNTFCDTIGSFNFCDWSIAGDSTHEFAKSGIEVDGNLFSVTTGQTGQFLIVDSVTVYTIFTSIQNNVMTDGLDTYVKLWNGTTQTLASSQNWATFTASNPDNAQETWDSASLDATYHHRPSVSAYPVITSEGQYRPEGVLATDLYGVARRTSGQWAAGAVSASLSYIVLSVGGNMVVLSM